MTEKERPTGINSEALTGKPNPPRMGERGDIFMPEEREDSPGRNEENLTRNPEKTPTTSQETVDYLAGLKETKLGEKSRPEFTREESITMDEIMNLAGFSGEFKLEIAQDMTEEQVRQAKAQWEGDKSGYRGKLEEALVAQKVQNENISTAKIYEVFKERIESISSEENPEEKRKMLERFLRDDIVWFSALETIIRRLRSKEFTVGKDIEHEFIKKLEDVKAKIGELRKSGVLKDIEVADMLGMVRDVTGLSDKEGDGARSEINIGTFLHQYEGIKGELLYPKSIEDLARLFMDSSGEEWRTGGKNELINSEGKFLRENFMAWIRDRILHQHDITPDGDINLFSEIQIFTPYRGISFMEMYSTPKYFMTEQSHVSLSGKTRLVQEVVKREELEKLKNQALYEVWLFQMSHNYDAKYRATMGAEEELPKTLFEIYYNNVFTKDKKRLLNVLKLSGNSKEELDEILKQENLGDHEMQGAVGKAIRKVILSYYFLAEINNGITIKDDSLEFDDPSEKNMFEQTLGNEGVLEFYRAIIKKVEDVKSGTGEERIIESEGDKEILTRRAHVALRKKWGLKNGIRDLNFFSDVNTTESVKALTKDALTAAIRKTKDINGDDLKKEDAKYAAEWASTMIYWTGISARNDINGVGFDAWSKVINTNAYRLSQVEGKSLFGDLQTIFGIRRIGLTFFEGLKVAVGGSKDFSQRTLIEAIQGGEGDTINLDKALDFEFQGNAQRQFMVNHVQNAFKFYNVIMRDHGINLDKFTTLDQFGRIIFDKKEMDKVFGGLWKNLRYSFDLPDFLWHHKVRTWETEDIKGERVARFKTTTLDKAMFNREVLGLKMYNEELMEDDSRKLLGKRYRKDIDDNYIRDEYYIPARKEIARNVFAYLIAKELWMHRNWESGFTRYTLQDIEVLQGFFMQRAFGVIENKDNNVVKAKNNFFNKREWDQIAKMGDAEFSKIFWEEFRVGVASGSLSAIWQTIKALGKEVTR